MADPAPPGGSPRYVATAKDCFAVARGALLVVFLLEGAAARAKVKR
jgi:hypothetical protein